MQKDCKYDKLYEDIHAILQSMQVSTRILNNIHKSISSNYDEDEPDECLEKQMENIEKIKDLLHNSQNRCIEIHQSLLFSKTEKNSEFIEETPIHTPPIHTQSPPPQRNSRSPPPPTISSTPFNMMLQRSISNLKKTMSFRANPRIFVEISDEL